MKKPILLLLMALTLNSCFYFGENGIEVLIENNSGTSITDLKFTTSEDLNSVEFEEIHPDEKVSDFLNMDENSSDGTYVLQFTRGNGKKDTSGAGYYTNGGSLNSRVTFVVEKDTVIASTSHY